MIDTSEETRNAFKFTKFQGKLKIVKTKLSKLRQGDIFYMEESDGELVTGDDGEFIMKATTDPKDDLRGLWGLKIDFLS